MPELPEVEYVRKEVSERYTGMTLIKSEGQYEVNEAVGETLERVDRKGKYLLLRFSEGWVVIHLGMTGQVHLRDTGLKHTRSVLRFDRGELAFVDPRGFGSVTWLPGEDLRAHPGLLGRLGPDPLSKEFSVREAAEILSGRDCAVKVALLDQKAVAGVGNYIADESLWRAQVNPARKDLDLTDSTRVVEAVLEVMHESLSMGGVSVKDYQHADGSKGSAEEMLAVYGRAGEPCERCGRELSKSTVGGRGTTWCGKCQNS